MTLQLVFAIMTLCFVVLPNFTNNELAQSCIVEIMLVTMLVFNTYFKSTMNAHFEHIEVGVRYRVGEDTTED